MALVSCTTAWKGVHVDNSSVGPDGLSVIYGSGGVITSLREAFTQDSADMVVEDGSGFRAGDQVLVTDFDTPEGGQKIGQRFGLDRAIPFMAVFDRDGQRVWAGNGSQMSPAGLDALIGREIDHKTPAERP